MSPAHLHSRIPVIMYHGIGRPDPAWPWYGLTVGWRFFDKQMQTLREAGYHAITLTEFAQRQASGCPPEERLVVLTFDDGYLDNWVYAAPIMRRHGMRGTIYVNPDFLDPSEAPRPTVDDGGRGGLSESELPAQGFMNAHELRAGVAAGVFEIGCHSRTHTWYPTGPTVVDYHRPGSWHPWLAWNARPDRKHAYLGEDQTGFVPWGTPVHEHGRSLGIRRWHPTEESGAAAVAYVQAHGGAAFFEMPDWREQLDGVTRHAGTAGRHETDGEMIARFRDEIVGGRTDLETRLGLPAPHFAWPGGAYRNESWEIAESAGFETIVVSRNDPSRWDTADPRLVRRISCYSRLSFLGKSFANSDPALLLHACEVERGNGMHRHLLRARKLRMALSSLGQSRNDPC